MRGWQMLVDQPFKYILEQIAEHEDKTQYSNADQGRHENLTTDVTIESD